MTDPIADMLTRIRNACMVRKPSVSLPYSKLKFAIAQKMAEAGYIKEVVKEEGVGKPTMTMSLKYKGKLPHITEIHRVSKPGLRIYVKSDSIPKVKGGYGTAFLSTSQGLMTDEQAREKGVGGELVCTLY
ncbi:MAG: 30S ribosomal protein S8 [Parcubacteria group bacterium]|nr:30S ribosomal protein S8 [Parcubacteria group bacterium]